MSQSKINNHRKLEIIGIEYDYLVIISITAIVIQLFVDHFELVPFGVVFIYAFLPSIAAPLPGFNQKPYNYCEYVPKPCDKYLIILLIIVAYVFNCLLSGFIKYHWNLHPDFSLDELIYYVGTKTGKWMGIHAGITACVVTMSYFAINKIADIEFHPFDKKWICLTATCCLFSVFIMTPAGTIGFHYREINNSTVENKYTVKNIAKDEKTPITESNSSVSNSSTVVNISTVANNQKVLIIPIRSFVVDNLIITIASAILSAAIVHCFLLTLDKKPRDFILHNLDNLVASIALLHISTDMVSAVGNFPKEHKMLLLPLLFVQYYSLFLACFRITLFVINRISYKCSFLSSRKIEEQLMLPWWQLPR